MNPSPTILDLLATDSAVGALAEALVARRRVVATGAAGSSTTFIAAHLARKINQPVILILAHLDEADEALAELGAINTPALRLPALESLPGETGAALDLVAERLAAVRDVISAAPAARVLLCPIQALMQGVPELARLDSLARTITRGQRLPMGDLTRWLDQAGYKRADAADEPGDFAIRGGILDIFPPGGAASPVRLDFFGDDVDKINEIDPDTMGSDRSVNSVQLITADEKVATPDDRSINFLELLPRNSIVLLAETMEIVEQARGYYERIIDARGVFGPPAVLKLAETRFHALAEINQFSAGASAADTRIEIPVSVLPSFARDTVEAVIELASLPATHAVDRVLVCCQNAAEHQRFSELLAPLDAEQRSRISSSVAYLHRGFLWGAGTSSAPHASSAFVPYHELIGRFTARPRAGRLRAARAMDTFLDFAPGDYVVHTEHGIARYVGLKLLKPREVQGHVGLEAEELEAQLARKQGRAKRDSGPAGPAEEAEEYLTLEFAGSSRLHVPATKIDQVQKYVGGFAGKPPLSTIGGVKWKNQKERVSDSVQDLAAEMLRVRAAREHMPGTAYPPDTPWQHEFEEEFPYEETEDQLAALSAIKKDMTSPKPMDRLICGDVGFGKTELAIRAAFKVCETGKQVAVLVPTTVLAEQHESTFRSRFAGYPFRVESLSRFKTVKEANDTLAAVRRGEVDVIIGTHRILSADVRFKDLGLVVIDEEQRFGVEHKERLLQLRLTVDVLTLSATPIPRTLHMAMLGLRDISSLTTPPVDRRAIVTEVIPYNHRRLAQAIARELSREGQVFYVHNRVFDIRSVADRVSALAPGARVIYGHGQMPAHELEEVMLKFMRRQADILVSTTIIESGIDIPTANTMIVDDADRFGLAELHQLRGRVGRSRHRAYCYLLLPNERNVTEVAKKRLRAVEQYSMLGAGFKIAMRDLEIRGAGNLLGAEQSGHIAAVGYEMYCRLLEQAVKNLSRPNAPPAPSATSIEIGVSGLIPRAYIPSEQRRLEAYRRIAVAASPGELDKVLADLTEAYGAPPAPVTRLLDLAALRIAAASLHVRAITLRDRDVVFRCPDPVPVAAALTDSSSNLKTRVTVLPPKSTADLPEVYFRPPENALEGPTLLRILQRRLSMAVGNSEVGRNTARAGA